MSRRLLMVLSLSLVMHVPAPALAQSAVTGKAVATFDGAGANAWSGNIRASDEEVVSLLEEGIQRSSSFKGLVDRLAKSDVIIYVRPDVTARNNQPTRMSFLTAKGGYRYLVVRVASGRAKDHQISMLGHELQHAVSIADAPSVQDSPSLRREFERIGKVTQPGAGDDFFFSSQLADETKRRILSEVSVQGAKSGAPRVATTR